MSAAEIADLLSFSVNPLELLLRGTLMYWFLFLLFRFVLRRDAGSIGIADILLLVLIADASQNAMAGSYETVADGMLLVVTLAAWNWLLDWLGYYSSFFRRFVQPPAVVLVRQGELVRRNLRREFITMPELMASLHENGIENLADVKVARLESDGEISVIKREKGEEGAKQAPQAARPPA